MCPGGLYDKGNSMPQLRCERTGDVFVITLDNPAAANALDDTTLDEFNAHLDAIEATEGNVALLITAEGEFLFPAPRVEVVDTTGAGDAFVGGLLFTLSRENYWNHALLAEAISNANACGAMDLVLPHTIQ